MRIAVLGSDARMQWAARELARHGLDVGPNLEGADVLLCPPAGAEVSEADLSRLAPGAAVLTGQASAALRQRVQELRLALVEYLEDEAFATLNAVPTAEGAIALAMELTPFTLCGSRCLVTGFGRLGTALAPRLRALGAAVTVCAQPAAEQARARAAGLAAAGWDERRRLAAATDIAFNTVPAPCLTAAVLRQMPAHTVVIDLASQPGGTDWQAAAALGLTARAAPGLPARAAPATAGRILAGVVLSHLRKERGELACGLEGSASEWPWPPLTATWSGPLPP